MFWDVFISHAGEDKAQIARPLAAELTANGLTVWLDENELRLGESLRGQIDHGLAHSRAGVVVLSRAFFAKHWPVQELNGLSAMECSSQKMILPVWHGVDHEFVAGFSPILADRVAVSTDRGIDFVAAQVVRALAGKGAAGSAPKTRRPAAPQTSNDGWQNDPRVRQGVLRITPILPVQCQQDDFRLAEVRPYELILSKTGTAHGAIAVPRVRVKEPLFAGEGSPVTLVLDGRLQWLSAGRDWKFFPEAPATAQERQLGFSKFSFGNDPRIQEASARLQRYGIGVGFVREDRLAQALAQGKQVVYDDDGLYFRWQGPDIAQILVGSRA